MPGTTMPQHEVVADDFFFSLFGEDDMLAPYRKQEYKIVSDLDLQTSDPVKPLDKPDKPPKPPLRSLVSKAFITSCKDKTLYRTRSLPFLKDVVKSSDQAALLGGDQLISAFNFEEGSETTADLISESSTTTPPYVIPAEQKRLKKQVLEWKSKMSRSFKSVVAKRQYRTMAEKLFDGIEAPLREHESTRYWNKAHGFVVDSRDEDPTLRIEEATQQAEWSSIHPPHSVNFGALDSPTMSTLSKEPILTVCYEDQCAQLVFRETSTMEDDEDRPFDEYLDPEPTEPGSSSSDEEENQHELPPSSSPGKPLGVVFSHPSWLTRQAVESTEESQPVLSPISSPQKALGVAFSHPSWVKRQTAEQKDEYGNLWETLGDPDIEGDMCHQISYSRNLFASSGRGNADQAPSQGSLAFACFDDFPFDEVVADDVVQSDPYGNILGVEVTASFDRVTNQNLRSGNNQDSSMKRELVAKKRPVCSCVKCSASSIYADLYPNDPSN